MDILNTQDIRGEKARDMATKLMIEVKHLLSAKLLE